MKKAIAIPRLPEEKIGWSYRQYRRQVFISVYLGYAFFYITRKNIASALPSLMEQLQLSKAEMGVVLSLFSATYALAKLVNGSLWSW